MALTFKEVAEILKIIDASDCQEVVLELEGVKLSVRRGGSDGMTVGSEPMASVAPAAITNHPAVADSGAASRQVTSDVADAGMIEVRAPMVGTFYRRPSPEKPPLVEVGSVIEPGTPLFLIEVMKLYTTVEATSAGTVAQILVEDGELVEFDQILLVIQPA